MTFPDYMTAVYPEKEMRWQLQPKEAPGKQLFRVLHDWEFSESWHRTKVPEVYHLDDRGTIFDEPLQKLSYDLFCYGAPSLEYYGLEKSRHASLYDKAKAFANRLGYGATDPPRKNYITGENLNNKDAIDPKLDKVRVCGGATVAGTIQRGYQWHNYITGKTEIIDFVWLETLDPDNLPPIGELILMPWLYFHATVAYKARAGMFPNGIIADDGIYEPTLVPLVSKYAVGWPLKYLQPVDHVADPYTFDG